MNVASKSAQQEPEKAEVIEEALDVLDKLLDRVKVLYEQYFLGIQKQPPQHLHTDVERKLRELTQLQIRNTALRYRFATLQQKFGSYNTYWRRTLREIEAGRYHRSLSRVSRRAAATGMEIPPEILAAMPQRMREQVRRDREAALALQRHRESMAEVAARQAASSVVGQGDDDDDDDEAGESFVRESTEVRQRALMARGALHVIDDTDAEIEIDALLDAVEDEESDAVPRSVPVVIERTGGVPVAIDRTGGVPVAVDRTGGVPVAVERTGRVPVAVDRTGGVPAAIDRTGSGPAFAARPTSGPAGPVGERPPGGQSGQVRPPVPPPPVRPPSLPKAAPVAPSQQTRPTPVVPGASRAIPPVIADELKGPFPQVTPARARPPSPPPSPTGAGPDPGAKPARIDAGTNTPARSPVGPTRSPPVSPSMSRPPTAGAPPRPPSPPTKAPPVPQSPSVPPSPPSPPSPPTGAPRAVGAGPPSEARPKPPPGMSESDVSSLYARYIEAKRQVGEAPGPGSFDKLMRTIHDQAPKIMEQYRAKGVDFSVAIKDNQVVIRAKPKL